MRLHEAIQHETVGLQGKIQVKGQQMVALQSCIMGYLENKDKNNGTAIFAKSNEEAEYPNTSICGQHSYSRHKTRVYMARNQGSTLFTDGNTSNAIETCNFWGEHRLIVVHLNPPTHFRIDVINCEQPLNLNNG